MFLANRKWWESLPQEIQRAIEEAAVVASLYSNSKIQESEAELRSKMEKEGVTFIEVDPEPFRKRAEEAVPSIAHVWGGDIKLYERIRDTG